MGRNRKPGDDWLPLRVYRGRSAFEYRPKGGKCVRLCGLDADHETVRAAWRTATAAPDPASFAALLAEYLDSPRFADLARETRRAYARYADQLRAVFGHMKSNSITAPHVRQWMDARGTARSQVLANREMAMLGAVFRWGYERGRCAGSPTVGVRRFVERPRDRIVTEAELEAFAAHASPRLRAYLLFRMATGLRQGEVLALPLRALTQPDGVHVDAPSKGGKRRIIEWSPALELARDAILALPPVARTYTWPARGGTRLTQAGFQVEWQRAMTRFVASGGERFHEHDLRAAAVQELTIEHAQGLLGHQRAATTVRHYRRGPERVKPAR